MKAVTLAVCDRLGPRLGHLLFAFFLFLPAGSLPLRAQHHLFGETAGVHPYGGLVARLTSIDGSAAALFGGRAGVVVSLSPAGGLGVGGGMYGLMTAVRPGGEQAATSPRYLRFGYGGIELAYLVHPARLVHLSVSTLLGVGSAGYAAEGRYDGHGFGHGWGGGPGFFVLEPGLDLTLNVAPLLRLGTGAGYRFVTEPPVASLRAADLSGPAVSLTLLLGRH